jgi:hypothetical protein
MRHKEKTANQSQNVHLVCDVEILKVLHRDAFLRAVLWRRRTTHRVRQSLRQRSIALTTASKTQWWTSSRTNFP